MSGKIKLMQEPNFEEAIQYALLKLRAELPKSFTYHNVWHTQVEVATAVSRFAKIEQLPEKELELLQVAVAYHDIGFITFPQNHEWMSIREVQKILPKYGFNKPQIETISNMIGATRLPQSPQTLAEMILADADLEVLGRKDFFTRNQALRDEFRYLNRPFTQEAWLKNQLDFLQNHTYFTQAAQSICRKQKQRNIELIQKKLAKYPIDSL
ncbi:MAG: HD domain-containing protein [Chloroflexota bacterium]